MNWKVTFFNDKVVKETHNFPKGILANFLRIVEMIEEFGPTLGMPYTSPLAVCRSDVSQNLNNNVA